jgi:hypothetical protein
MYLQLMHEACFSALFTKITLSIPEIFGKSRARDSKGPLLIPPLLPSKLSYYLWRFGISTRTSLGSDGCRLATGIEDYTKATTLRVSVTVLQSVSTHCRILSRFVSGPLSSSFFTSPKKDRGGVRLAAEPATLMELRISVPILNN